jgi:hypothetical protein
MEEFKWVRITVTVLGGSDSEDSAIGVATAHGLDNQGAGVRISEGPDMLRGPRFLLSNGYKAQGAHYPGLKRPGHKANHLQPVSRSGIRGSKHTLPHTPSCPSI